MLTDKQLIEAMARAMFKDDQTCRLEIAKAIFEVCKPTIEAPLRAENEKLRNSLQDMTVRYSESIGEREKLRAALKPFAELWSIRLIAFNTEAPDDYTFRQSISCGIVRAAAAALKETGE